MVRTELSVARCQPGGTLSGSVEVTGGMDRASIGYVALVLQTNGFEFHRREVVDGFSLGAGERRLFEVSCDVPWEAPLSMPGVEVTLRTELEVARAVDRSDVDPIQIAALPAQQVILDALGGLGFHFIGSNVERGLLPGLPQTLPFYQEIEFLPGNPYSRKLNKLEATFVATAEKLHVVLEVDRRVSPLADRDLFGRFVVDLSTLADTDWPGLLDDWLSTV